MNNTINLPNDVEEIVFHLNRCGYDAYAVGGCVRDSLLGITPSDWDICTSATPAQMKTCFSEYTLLETGLQHGTVTLRYNHRSYEITTFRQDGVYLDNRRPSSVDFVTDIRDDLSRRDFTVNAMAYHPVTGLVDCYDGMKDLENKVIRCVGDAKKRFSEDALRIMRALRFASAYSFTIDDDTKKAAFLLKEHLTTIAAERICAELKKLVLSDGCYRILVEYRKIFEVFIPEISAADFWEHTVRLVSKSKKDLTVRLSLILNGISDVPSKVCAEVLHHLRFEKRLIHDVKELLICFDKEILPTEYCVKLWLNRIGPTQFERLLWMREADQKAFKHSDNKMSELECIKNIFQKILLENACYTISQLAVSGQDLIAAGISEGVMIGKLLQMLLEQVIANNLENKRETLLDFVKHQQKKE